MLFSLPPDDSHTPLYMQIIRHLKQQIRTGAARPCQAAQQAQPGRASGRQRYHCGKRVQPAGFRRVCGKPAQARVFCLRDRAPPACRRRAGPARRKGGRHGGAACDFRPAASIRAISRIPPGVVCCAPVLMRRTPRFCKNAPAQGLVSLRESIAQYLAQARGVRCRPSRSSSAPAPSIFCKFSAICWIAAGPLRWKTPCITKRTICSPAWAIRCCRCMSMKRAARFAAGALSHAAVYTTPSHQFPLGVSMPISRRVQLLNWAKSAPDRYIIEDDYDSEFRYDAKPLPSLQSIDDHGRVIYLGTFSKSIAPSLRIGYMVLPPSLLPLYQAQYAQFSCAVSRFEQQVLDAFLRQGAFETHLNRMRKLYKEKRKPRFPP